MLTHDQILRYSRHLLIPEVGLTGQQKLHNASALIIGAGGLGSPIALYLAAAGVGRIGLLDYDVVEETNLQRQIAHGMSSLGKRKVESARARMLDINPDAKVETYDQPFTSANALQIAANYDVLIDGSDNFPTRYLSNDVAVLLGKPLVYGSIFRFDGQASVFDARTGPCYRCLFPEPPPPGLVPTCAEGGVLGVLPGVIGSIQATEALKILLGIGDTLQGRLLLYNALDMSFDFVTLRKNPQCRICGENPQITQLIDYEAFCGVPGQNHPVSAEDWDITAPELARRLQTDSAPLLLDVREPHELQISALPGALNIPLGTLAARLSELDSAREMVVLCRAGTRSIRAVGLLTAAGFRRVKTLQGGIHAWAREVDPSLAVY